LFLQNRPLENPLAMRGIRFLFAIAPTPNARAHKPTQTVAGLRVCPRTKARTGPAWKAVFPRV
jgi:hypothetical protein